MSSNDSNISYKPITENFLGTIDKKGPLKMKFITGNQVTFMNRDFQKAIYTRARLKNKDWRNPFRENELAYKKQRNLYVSVRRKSIKYNLYKFSDKGQKLILLEINQAISDCDEREGSLVL